MNGSRPYLVAVVLLAVLAVAFGVFGTVAPPLAEESGFEPQQESSSESVGHFTNPPTYDSGWVNITTKTGQYVTLGHGLNTTDVVVDLRGKQSLDPMNGALAWNETYDSTATYAYGIIQTSDGGYALAGSGGANASLVKTDASGNMQWSKTYGGAGGDGVYGVVQTLDGGYALAGWTGSFGAGAIDFWLVKTDSTGTVQWNKTYGGTGDDRANCVIRTGDGGYALVGSTNSYGVGIPFNNLWLVKTDSTGIAQWNQTYGGTSNEEGYSMIQTGDGEYALIGHTVSYGAGSYDFWLVKTDSMGAPQWNRTYGGVLTSDDRAFSGIQTNDGGYALAGRRAYDFWLVKTDASGNMQWNQIYGGTSNDAASCVIRTLDGGYALAGYTYSYGADAPTYNNFWLVKTNSTGTAQWNQTYGGTRYDVASKVVQTGDGGYALAGYSNSYSASYDFLLVKVNAEMDMEHKRNFSTEVGLAWTGLTNTTITLYRGETDPYWNYVRVRIWTIKEPSWIYGDINMDGIVDGKDLYVIGKNYGQTFSLLSLSGIAAVASIHTVKTRKQQKPLDEKHARTEP